MLVVQGQLPLENWGVQGWALGQTEVGLLSVLRLHSLRV